jgi:hypothetical protein
LAGLAEIAILLTLPQLKVVVAPRALPPLPAVQVALVVLTLATAALMAGPGVIVLLFPVVAVAAEQVAMPV